MTSHTCAASCLGVRFEKVSVDVSGRKILENITAEAPCGGATVIVGPNGAGKTTLLRCLLGEIKYSGQIEFLSSQNESHARPNIGYVPQQLMCDAHMPLRVYEFLILAFTNRPLWLGCSKKARQMAKEYLKMVEAEKLESRRMGALSGGETRRVLLAAALSKKPNLLVLDEAEAGVDYRGERMFWQLLDQTRRELGFSLIMVSHNLPLAAHYATHVICVKTRLIAQGSPCDTLTASNLLTLFGVPIHLYPQQCGLAGPACPECGALGKSPYYYETVE